MSRNFDERRGQVTSDDLDAGVAVVFAGPGSSITLPGIIASEIAGSLTDFAKVIRVDVDPSSDFTAGIHRAPSLTSLLEGPELDSILVAPRNSRERAQFFRSLFGRDVDTAVAYAWPGLDNHWLAQFVRAARDAGSRVVVAGQSVAGLSWWASPRQASLICDADSIVLGDAREAHALRRLLGSSGPAVSWHEALALVDRESPENLNLVSAFIPRGDLTSLRTLISAFDAIPDSWVERYALRVMTRIDDLRVPTMVAESHHRAQIEVVGDEMTSDELAEVCDDSSALSVAVPQAGSRVMAAAIEQGVGIVVMRNGELPPVGQGYVGGLLADRESATSLLVGLTHALRLTRLRFPRPSVWESLAKVLFDESGRESERRQLESAR